MNGKKNGICKITYSNGCFFECNFIEDLAEGQGIMKYNNGDLFKGNFNLGLKNGYGEY